MMSAAHVWILFPLLLSMLILALSKYRALAVSLASIFSLALSLLAAWIPIGEAVRIGAISLQINPVLNVLGRQFILGNGDRTFLTLIYGLGAVWFLVGGVTVGQSLFSPIGLAMIATLVGAFAVEPFFYAALLVEIAVLLSVPILSPPGTGTRTGVQRYLIFQTLAMPFILLAGWILGVGEANPADPMFQTRAATLLGLGFAFWLAVFPFHSWMPLLAQQTHPIPAGFIFSLLPTSVLLLALDFLNGFGWLRSSPQLYEVLLNVGVLMVVVGGLFAAVQQDLSRILGYAVIFQTGYALIAIGLNSLPGLMSFAGALLPGLLGIMVFVIALSALASHQVGFTYPEIRGLFRRYPFAAIGLLAAYASIGGLPLLASFPVRQETLELLADQSFLLSAWASAGSLAFLVGGGRVLAEMVMSAQSGWEIHETWLQRILLLTGTLFLVLFGLFPRTFMSAVLFILRSFPILLQ